MSSSLVRLQQQVAYMPFFVLIALVIYTPALYSVPLELLLWAHASLQHSFTLHWIVFEMKQFMVVYSAILNYIMSYTNMSNTVAC
jgi:hypothetical protein